MRSPKTSPVRLASTSERASEASKSAAADATDRSAIRWERLACHAKFAAASAVIIVAVAFLIFEPEPMTASDGEIGPLGPDGKIITGQPLHAGQRVAVIWTQDWRRLCKIQFIPTVVDGSGKQTEFKDATGRLTFTADPPAKLGTRRADPREFILPPIVGPSGEYFSTLRPKCWFDFALSREYQTPPIKFAIVPPPAKPSPPIAVVPFQTRQNKF